MLQNTFTESSENLCIISVCRKCFSSEKRFFWKSRQQTHDVISGPCLIKMPKKRWFCKFLGQVIDCSSNIKPFCTKGAVAPIKGAWFADTVWVTDVFQSNQRNHFNWFVDLINEFHVCFGLFCNFAFQCEKPHCVMLRHNPSIVKINFCNVHSSIKRQSEQFLTCNWFWYVHQIRIGMLRDF